MLKKFGVNSTRSEKNGPVVKNAIEEKRAEKIEDRRKKGEDRKKKERERKKREREKTNF